MFENENPSFRAKSRLKFSIIRLKRKSNAFHDEFVLRKIGRIRVLFKIFFALIDFVDLENNYRFKLSHSSVAL